MASKFCTLLCHINVKLAWTVCGILISCFWSTIYIGWFKNWWALSVCLTSVCFAFESLFLYWAVKKHWVETWQKARFERLFWINLVIGIIAMFGMIGCILYAALNHQGFSPSDQHGQNMWSTATWFLVMIKWTTQNAIFAGLYMRDMEKKAERDYDYEDGDERIKV